jgi:rod shape determining protein RodA
MAQNQNNLTQNLDWVAVLIYILCILIGWFNIYAAVYSPEVPTSIFDTTHNAGKQMMWIGTTILLIICILVIDYKFYETFGFIIYGLFILLLVVVLFAGTEINGSRSWIKIGTFSLQPAEFAKLATCLALAKYLSDPSISLIRSWKNYLPIMGIIGLPALLILLSNETGSMLVFASFAIMLYREGLPGFIPAIGIIMAILLILTLLFVKWFIAAGIIVVALLFLWIMPKGTRRSGGTKATFLVAGLMIGVVFGVDFFINNVLQKHQRSRVMVLIDPDSDPRGAGWNVIQSKIAIGSGRLTGKGFLEGTQTKFDFVPEQSTDFIFCTVVKSMALLAALSLSVYSWGLLLGLSSWPNDNERDLPAYMGIA